MNCDINRVFSHSQNENDIRHINSKHDFINIQQQHIMLTVQLIKN